MALEAPRKASEAFAHRRRTDPIREHISELARLYLYVQHTIRAPETLYLVCLNRNGREVCIATKVTSVDTALTPIQMEVLEYGEMDFLHVSPDTVTAQTKRKTESFAGSHGVAGHKTYPMISLGDELGDFDQRVERYYRNQANAELRKSKDALDKANAIVLSYGQRTGEIKKSMSVIATARLESDRLMSTSESSLQRSRELSQLNENISRSLREMRAAAESLLMSIAS